MEFIVERKEFLDALNIGASMAGKRKILPVLDNVKIKIEETKAQLSSYDSEIAVSKSVDIVRSSEDGVFLVNAKDLTNALRSIKDDEITFTLDKMILHLKYKNGVIKLPYESADDFPKPNIEKENRVTLAANSQLVYSMLSDARNFVYKKDNLYPQLSCVCLYLRQGKIGVVSTDRNMEYKAEYEYGYDGQDLNVLITYNAIPSLLGLLSCSSNIKISDSERNVLFRNDSGMLVSVKPEGVFPKMAFTMGDSEMPIHVSLKRTELVDAINRCSISTSTTAPNIAIKVTEDNLQLRTEDLMGNKSTVENVPCECVGDTIEIGFNAAYLLQCLSVFSEETIYLLLESPIRMGIMLDNVNDKRKTMLMPCVIV